MNGIASGCVRQSQGVKFRVFPADQPSSRPPVVLIHGWASSSETWSELIPAFTKTCDVYTVDLPACGDNTFFGDVSVDELLGSLADGLPKKCNLVGWSLGGMLATRLAARYPAQINSLVTLASNLRFVASDAWPAAMPPETFRHFSESFAQNPADTVKRFCALQALGDAKRKAVQKKLLSLQAIPTENQVLSWENLLGVLAQLDNVEYIEKIACPSLHIFGENDALVPKQAARELAANYSNHTVELISNAGHALHLSQTAAVVEKVSAFLSASDAGDPYKKEKQHIVQSFDQAATRYDAAATLQYAVATALCGLQSVSGKVLDLGCGTGFVSELLLKENPNVALTLVDISQSMLHQAEKKLASQHASLHFVSQDMDNLTFANQQFDFVVSSMSVQWSADLLTLFNKVWACLKPGGRFVFSIVGENSLRELAEAWCAVDDYVHVNAFLSQSELVEYAKTADFVVESNVHERHVQHFPSVIQLMQSLKSVGAHNVNTGRNHGLTSRARLRALEAAYEQFNVDGAYPATWEIYYLVLQKQ